MILSDSSHQMCPITSSCPNIPPTTTRMAEKGCAFTRNTTGIPLPVLFGPLAIDGCISALTHCTLKSSSHILCRCMALGRHQPAHRTAQKAAAMVLDSYSHGLVVDRITTHLLWSRGANALSSGHSNCQIQKMCY